jgi:hypothetical protein
MNVANVVPWLFPKLGKEAFGSEIPHTPVQQRNSDQRDPHSALPDHMDSTARRTYPRFARTPSSNTRPDGRPWPTSECWSSSPWLLAALTFFPAIVLGPVAEHLLMQAGTAF